MILVGALVQRALGGGGGLAVRGWHGFRVAERSASIGSATRRSLHAWSRPWPQQRRALAHWPSLRLRARGFAAAAAAAAAADYPPHIKLNMPALSPTMKQGNLVNWVKQVGDQVAPGDVLAEIETDKATVEYESQDEGYMAKILVPAGTQDVPVGKLVGVVAENEDDVGAFKDFEAAESGGDGERDTSAVRAAQARPEPEPKREREAAPRGERAPATPAAPAAVATATAACGDGGRGGGRIFASPLARSLASEAGVDLASLTGTGPKGRIVGADVNEALERIASGEGAVAAAAPSTAEARRHAAELFAESKRTVPHYQLVTECRLDRAIDFVRQYNKRNGKAIDAGKQTSLELIDLLVKAVAVAARRVPDVNASWLGTSVRQFDAVDVAVQDQHGALAPVVYDACRRGVESIAQGRQDVVPGREDHGGGTVTVTASDKVQQYVAIVRPPQAAVLAFGRPERRVVPATDDAEDFYGDDDNDDDDETAMPDGAIRAAGTELEVATMVCATASFDHRVVDGAVGAQFMSHLQQCVEDPMSMLL